jgi:hypothetical protein
MNEYELERAERIAANKRRLDELVTTHIPIAAEIPRPQAQRSRPEPPPPRTKSARLKGEAAPLLLIDEHDRLVGTVHRPAEHASQPGAAICHCCRQIKNNLKADCTSEDCNVRWCANCLRNKCGEDADEVNALGNWRCGRCLGNCMCSMCRVKAGKKPLGALWPVAKAEGFASVAAYMVAKGMQ